MSISASIKALLNLRGLKQADLMEVLKVGSKQALSNKFVGGRWSAADLVAVADACGAKLAFVLPDGERVLISAADPVGADPVQASPAAGAGQGVPGPVFAGPQPRRVTPSCNRGEEKPLSD